MQAEITSYIQVPMGAYPGHYGMCNIIRKAKNLSIVTVSHCLSYTDVIFG